MLLFSGADRRLRRQIWLVALDCFLLLDLGGLAYQSEAAAESPAPPPVTIEEMSAPRRVWAGEEVKVSIVLQNQDVSERKVRLSWATAAASLVLERGSEDIIIPAEKKHELTFVIHAPQVERRTELVCEVLLAGQACQDRVSLRVSVFPQWEAASIRSILTGWRIGLVDFDGVLTSLLKEAGLAFQDVPSALAVRHFTGEVVLVVASDHLAADLLLHRELMQVAEDGIRIVWFDEGREWVGPEDRAFRSTGGEQDLSLAPIGEGTLTAPGHLAVTELLPGDLEHWRSADGVGLGPLLAWPEGGNFRALARARPSGGPLLLEMLLGKGNMIICQPAVLRCLPTEPAAHLLLRGLLQAATAPIPKLDPCALFAVADGRWDGLLRDLGTVALRNPDSTGKDQLAILCADEESEDSAAAQPAMIKTVVKHLAQGGKCLVLGAYPEVLTMLKGLGLAPAVIERSPDEARPSRITASYQHRQLWGVLAADLDSFTPSGASILPGSATANFLELVEPRIVWKCSPPGSPGTVIYAHFRPPPEPATVDRAVLMQLLTNLGVLIEREGPEGRW